ncbi:MAG TPA: hypothetical protein PK069_05605 [Methanolinea sp.]|nr:hypothetical protein [Methanolinea sp.]
MIVPMKKVNILCEAHDAESTVRSLRALGVMHVEHENAPESTNITKLREQVVVINSALDVLNQVGSSEKERIPQEPLLNKDWREVAGQILDSRKRYEQLEIASRGVIGQIQEWEGWGDIEPSEVQFLQERGVYIRLFLVPLKEVKYFPDDVVVKTIFATGDIAHCVAIARRRFECPYPEIALPKQSVSAMKRQLQEMNEGMESARKDLLSYARYRDSLSKIRRELEKEIEFQEVLSGMGRDGPISYVTGYIPFDVEAQLIAEARKKRWGVLINDPSDIDEVPTLIRNPKWASLIKPVLGLLGLTPGYRELDVSIPFLVFFSLFFGILIGDAGYGVAYILITLILQKVVLKNWILENPDLKTTFSLFYLLGCSAVIWGVLTGVFFGQTWLLNIGYVPPVPELNDPSFIQTFCFFIGALHLSIAHSWRAVLKFPSLTFLSDIGWICVLWTAFFLARYLILGEAFPSFGIGLISAGVLLVIFFTHPQRNVLKGIGTGLATVALSLMNNFTDVISYIRLFAVGLATLAIAETTNTLAFGFGNGIVALVASAVILITGHGLNIILGPMSVLVHGVRLNVLEFSGHANVTWSGTAFDPLKEE